MKKFVISKLKSKKIIEITQLDKDDWFYKIQHLDKKTRKVDSSGMIIKKQIPEWTEMLSQRGYLIEEQDI
jgi:hypothetical protein